MPFFVIISTDRNQQKIKKISTALEKNYENEHLPLNGDNWLIYSANEYRPQDVFQRLFGESKEIPSLILHFDSYWGIQPKHVWDWLQSKGL